MINKNNIFLSLLLLLFASFVTFVSMLIVVSNALTLGVTSSNQTIPALIALAKSSNQTISALIALAMCWGTHFVPALLKHCTGWLKLAGLPVWCLCLCVTMHNQLSYLTNVSTEAGENRAKSSVQLISLNQQIESVKQEISRIRARSLTVIARALSKATDDKRITELNSEQGEAKRSEKLLDYLHTLQNRADSIQIAEGNDPESSLIESVTGISAAKIKLFFGATGVLALESLATFLWYVFISKPHQEVKPEILVSSDSPELNKSPVPEAPASSDHEKFANLKHAVDTGEIKLAGDNIRKYLRCA
jgi:hypothetical protein